MSEFEDSNESKEATEEKQSTESESPDQVLNKPARAGRGIAFLALLLALASLLLAVWNHWQQRKANQVVLPDVRPELEAVSRQADDLGRRLDALSQSVDGLGQQNQDSDSREILRRIQSLNDTETAHSSRLGSLESASSGTAERLSALEQSLAGLAAIRSGNDRQLAKAEIAYLLRLADERLQLFADRDAALDTLRMADRQIQSLNDPLLNGVRRQLQVSIQDLMALEPSDTVAISSVLEAMEQNLLRWPVKTPKPDETEDAEPSQGFWSRVRSGLGSLVKVKRQGDEVFLSVDEIGHLRERIALELQIARMAALKAEQQLFEGAISRVQEWLENYFDSEDRGVSLAINTLKQLGQTRLTMDFPDITGAERQLQALRGFSGGAGEQPVREDQVNDESQGDSQ